MNTPARGLRPNTVPSFVGPVGDGRVPDFQQVPNGLHPGHVHEFITRLLGELNHLRAQLAHAAESPAGQALIEDLLAGAAQEIAGQRAAADQESARQLAEAGQQAQGIVASARVQADQIMKGATQQAGTVIEGARTEAKGMLDAASAKATAVDQAAARRVETLTADHEKTLARIREVHEHTTALLAAEEDRGPLEQEVTRALPATLAVKASVTSPDDEPDGK